MSSSANSEYLETEDKKVTA